MATAAGKIRDPNTLSNYDKFRTRHITADFKIDFQKKRLEGKVSLNLQVLDKAAEIVLDSSFVDVQDVTINDSKAKWSLEPRSEPYGSPLKVQVGSDIDVGKEVVLGVSMNYAPVASLTCPRSNWRPRKDARLYNGCQKSRHRTRSIRTCVSNALLVHAALINYSLAVPSHTC